MEKFCFSPNNFYFSVKFRIQEVVKLCMCNANKQFELRTQSFNGVIRHWLRLLVANKDIENKIFGIANKNESRKGSVKIEIGNQTKINLSTIFDICFYFNPLLQKDYIKIFLCAFWCSLFIGNFGAKTRIGCGSLIPIEAPNQIIEDFDLKFTFGSEIQNEDQLIKWYKDHLDKIKKVVENKKVNIDAPIIFKNLCGYLLGNNKHQNFLSSLKKSKESKWNRKTVNYIFLKKILVNKNEYWIIWGFKDVLKENHLWDDFQQKVKGLKNIVKYGE